MAKKDQPTKRAALIEDRPSMGPGDLSFDDLNPPLASDECGEIFFGCTLIVLILAITSFAVWLLVH